MEEIFLLGENIFENIRTLNNRIERAMEEKKEKCRLSVTQLKTLKFLFMNYGKTVYQKNICEFLKVRRSSTTSLLINLEKQGFIRRETLNNDKRKRSISLTEKGIAIRSKLQEKHTKVVKILSDVVLLEELRELDGLLDKFVKGIVDKIAVLEE